MICKVPFFVMCGTCQQHVVFPGGVSDPGQGIAMEFDDLCKGCQMRSGATVRHLLLASDPLVPQVRSVSPTWKPFSLVSGTTVVVGHSHAGRIPYTDGAKAKTGTKVCDCGSSPADPTHYIWCETRKQKG